MTSVNKAIIIGTVGRDPELKTTQNGKRYCYLSLATNTTWKDKNTGEKKEDTTWHSVKLYESLAENCVKFVTKGDRIYIEGSMKVDTYEKDGAQVTSFYVLGNAVQFIGKPLKENVPQGSNDAYTAPKERVYADKNNDIGFMDDTIPF